jgi:hypothetical protein
VILCESYQKSSDDTHPDKDPSARLKLLRVNIASFGELNEVVVGLVESMLAEKLAFLS